MGIRVFLYAGIVTLTGQELDLWRALGGLAGRFLFSVLLWPVAGCLVWTLALQMAGLPWGDRRLLFFAGGALSYLALQIFLWRPIFLYVMGHELTHALAALLHGGKADDLRVSSRGGAVKVNKSTFLVNLAPYFFPIYTFGVVLLYYVVDPKFMPAVLFLLGFTLAFHLALTAYSLREHQSDIAEVGWLFAVPFIVSVNCLVIAFVVGLCLPESPRFLQYLKESAGTLSGFSQWIASLFSHRA